MSFLPKSLRSTLIIYFLILILYLVASFFPSFRLWGIDWWAYYPHYVAFIFLGIGLIVAFGIIWLSYHKVGWLMILHETTTKPKGYLWKSIIVIIISGLLFYLLRVQTHFLGDGYNLLTQFEKGIHLVRFTGWGESILHIQIWNILGGDIQRASLASFRIISIASGLIFVAFVLYSARCLFDRPAHRYLFILGLISSGYMLLFFGYVEYYSCFIMAVGIFTLTGVMVARKIVSRWFILPSLLMSIFCHIFGLILLPGALYLLLSESQISKWYGKISLSIRLIVILSGIIIGGFVAYYYTDSLFLQLSLVPLTANQFTMEGYTLFSLSHLGDITNLLMVLIPSLPLLVALFFTVSLKKQFRQTVYRFLIISILFSGLAVFLLQPRLGMPRDWDFFAFTGIPLTVFLFYFLFDMSRSIKGYIAISILTVSLGLLVLVPRVIGQNRPEIIIPHFEGYLQQNRKIESEGRAYLIEYYNRKGMVEAEEEQRRIWNEENIEGIIVDKGIASYEKGDYYSAVGILKKAIELSPIHSPIYNNIGKSFIMMNNYDSALYYFDIAYALNPYNASNNINLGVAYFFVKDYKRAEQLWQKALELCDTVFSARVYLLQMFSLTGEKDKYYQHLQVAGYDKYATADIVRQLGDYYLQKQDFDQAAAVYRKALEKGLDTLYIINLQKKYPSLNILSKKNVIPEK